LLELSRLEAADGDAPREPIDVPRMLERLQRDALARSERPSQVLLDVESTNGLYGASNEIESAFTNLLVNGLKYTNPEGTVRMRWWSDEDGAHFSVIDSGIGIPPEHIPRLTERFYRVDAGRSRGHGGSGLGLAIVKHALQRHDGWLDVESTEGKGSTFTCHFPLERVWKPVVRAAASA
jgi:two-component system phosphate regulon sensor histidine kinase PhoR